MHIDVPSFLAGCIALPVVLFVVAFSRHIGVRRRFSQEEDFPVQSKESRMYQLKFEVHRQALNLLKKGSWERESLEHELEEDRKKVVCT